MTIQHTTSQPLKVEQEVPAMDHIYSQIASQPPSRAPPKKVELIEFHPSEHGSFIIPELDKEAVLFVPTVTQPETSKEQYKPEPMKKYRRQHLCNSQPHPANVLSAEEIEEANDFDWATETEGCKESFNEYLIVKVIEEFKKSREMSAIENQDAGVFDLAAGQQQQGMCFDQRWSVRNL